MTLLGVLDLAYFSLGKPGSALYWNTYFLKSKKPHIFPSQKDLCGCVITSQLQSTTSKLIMAKTILTTTLQTSLTWVASTLLFQSHERAD